MKQLKFLIDTVDEKGIPIWYKGMSYQTKFEGENEYMLFCEDMKMRGMDKALEGEVYEVIING